MIVDSPFIISHTGLIPFCRLVAKMKTAEKYETRLRSTIQFWRLTFEKLYYIDASSTKWIDCNLYWPMQFHTNNTSVQSTLKRFSHIREGIVQNGLQISKYSLKKPVKETFENVFYESWESKKSFKCSNISNRINLNNSD